MNAAATTLFRKGNQREKDVKDSVCNLSGFAVSAQAWVIFGAPKTASACLNSCRNKPENPLLE